MALLDRLDIENATIAGCSVGGLIAQALALHHPTRAKSLILSNTAARIGTNESWQSRITAVEIEGLSAIAETILDRWFPPPFRTSPEALPWATMLLRTDPKGYVQTCRALARADLRADLNSLTLPTLFIAGAHDLATPPELVAETAALIAGARMITLPTSGHIPAIDAPKATAAAIAAFLESLHV